ncbi:radical SAM protein [bacterium]|nr:radical SAM protein [bacterium]
MRSKFPDLIFQDVLESRGEKILNLLDNPDAMENAPLDRVTLFITHRCNLHCKYCNGPHKNEKIPKETKIKMLLSDFPLSLYKKLIKEWVKQGLKYIHFTGGEPTLHPQLPEFVRIAKENGILTSIATNGTTSVELFRKLVENGLYEFQISVDSFNPYIYESITGVKGSYDVVKRTIKELVKMRDEEGKDIFIIINSVSSEFNPDNIKKSITQLVELKPDDMKILLNAGSKDKIYENGKRAFINEILHYLKDKKINMELLKDKILHFFRKNSYGLMDDESNYVMDKCYLPLTERTLDANGIYPCSIYLRNYGDPIASPKDSFVKQQKDIMRWVDSNKCPFDDICEKHCTYCTKKFNLHVNKKLREKEIEKEFDGIIIKADKIEKTKKEEAYKTLKKIKNVKLNHIFPYMIIKPEAQEYKDEILSYIRDEIYGDIEVLEIHNWNTIAFFLYAKNYELNEKIKRNELRFIINNAHSKIDDNHATLIILPEEVPLEKLKRIKLEVRNWFGLKTLKVLLPDSNDIIKIIRNYVHSPDSEKLFYDLQILSYFKIVKNRRKKNMISNLNINTKLNVNKFKVQLVTLKKKALFIKS